MPSETAPVAPPGRLAAAAAAIRARPLLARSILAGPVALVCAIATLGAMPLWLPAGAAGINDIAFPILLAPLLWAVPFFYAVLEEDLVRGSLVLGAATAVQAGLIAAALAG